VCERADVGRSTFYVHFADKEELLVSGFGELRKQLQATVVAEASKPLAFTRALLEQTREYEPVYRDCREGALTQPPLGARPPSNRGPPELHAARCIGIPRWGILLCDGAYYP
jgi:AcrR family transcriptional regulator